VQLPNRVGEWWCRRLSGPALFWRELPERVT
jgi:hypothetical protein